MLRKTVNLAHVIATHFKDRPALQQVSTGIRIPDYVGSALYYMDEQKYDINHLRRCLEFGLGLLKRRGKKDLYARREGAEIAERFGYGGEPSEWRDNLDKVISDLRNNKEVRFLPRYGHEPKEIMVPAVE